MTETPDEILRALANPERLAIAGSLASADATATSLADLLQLPAKRTGSTPRRCDGRPNRSGHLAGPACRSAPPATKRRRCSAHSCETAASRRSRQGVEAKDRARALALEFEPGVHYDEKTVNAIVGRFYNDFAALRRYLVDGGFLDRDRGEYWRSGGRVQT